MRRQRAVSWIGVWALLGCLIGCADSQVAPGDACAVDDDCGADRVCLDGACGDAPDAALPSDRGLPPDVADPDAAPDMRIAAIGDPCDGADDCITGPCIEAAGDGRRVCTGPCNPADPDCPDGFVCAAVGNAGPDRTFLCFPEADFLCRACEDDSDCGGLSDRCLDLTDGRFCGRACDLRACPEGYSCSHGVEDGAPNCGPNGGVCSGCFDPDGDGYGVGEECLGSDCAPEDGQVSPGAEEQCNGADDDCDGATDEAFDLSSDPERCGDCETACRLEGAEALCLDGACALGPCLPARYDLDRRVDNGCEYFCEGDPLAAEVCNGEDDDCDGAVDEGRPGADALCETGDPGRCAAGSTRCAAGELVCERRFDPLPETCDGSDEDCDGAVDENLDELGACETGRPGRCATGVRLCVDGGAVCEARPGPRGEVCDDIDDDCDDTVDNGCPAGVSTGADRNLSAFGGGGGGPFDLRCGAGQAAVGVDVRSAAEIDQVTVICQRVGLAVDRAGAPHRFSSVAEGGQARTGSAGGGGGGLSTLVCPAGSFLHALQVRSGARVDRASFTCARLDFVGYPGAPRITRSDTGSQAFGGQGGGANAVQRCRDDELMAGLHGRSGGRVDRLGPICRSIGVPVR